MRCICAKAQTSIATSNANIALARCLGCQKKSPEKSRRKNQTMYSRSSKAEWPNLKAVGMVRCHRTEKKTGKESSETRFFITSLTDAGKACQAMRSHWGVENGLHWELDVVFGEDLSQLRKDNSAANMNIIRKLVINILKQTDFSEFTKAKSLSILGKQMLCDKREECLEKVCRNI